MVRQPDERAGIEEFRASTGGVRLLAGLLIVAAVTAGALALAFVRGLALVGVFVAIAACTTLLVRLLKLAFAAPLISLDDSGMVVRGLGWIPWRDLDRVTVRPGRAGQTVGFVLHDTNTFTESRRAALADLPPIARLIARASSPSLRLNRKLLGAHVFISVGALGAPAVVAAIEARHAAGSSSSPSANSCPP